MAVDDWLPRQSRREPEEGDGGVTAPPIHITRRDWESHQAGVDIKRAIEPGELLRTEATHTAVGKAGPLAATERIAAIDALRGIALFGVLIINLVMEFRVSIFEQFLNQPSIRGPLDPILDTLLLLLFSQKALALFSLLFGLGLAIQFDRLRENPYRLRLLLRRLTALLAIGLLHLLLIWNGDILTEYAVAGFIVLPFLWGPRWLSAAAAAAFLSLYLIMPFLPVIVALPTQAWIMQHIAEATRAYGQGGLPKYSRSDSMRYQPFSRCISSFSHAPLRSSYLEHSSGGRVFCARSMHTRLLGVLAAILLPVGLGLSALHEGLTPFNRSSLGVLWFMIERSAPVILALGYAATVLALIAAGGWRLFAGQRLSGGWHSPTICSSR
jgi:uncharacterized protein